MKSIKINGNLPLFCVPAFPRHWKKVVNSVLTHNFAGWCILTHNFATANTETTTHNLKTLTTAFQLVSQLQNCELKQEFCTQATALQQVSQPQNCELKQELCTLATALQQVSQPQNCELKQEFCTQATALHQPLQFRNRERKYFLALAGLVWNCSEIATSRRNFVLTLNRALALKVKGNEQNILLPQNIVATTNRVGLESKLHHSDFVANCLF